jgi:hypothetical protein
MKKCFIYILSILSSYATAQTANEQKYLLTSASNTLGYSNVSFNDPYLSPLTYSGSGLGYDFQSQRFLSVENTRISKFQKLSLLAGKVHNPPYSASMSYFGFNYGWGLRYHLKPMAKLRVQLGGLWDLDFMFKYLARNVNNPVNVDLGTNLNAFGSATYDISLFRKEMKVKLDLKSPVLGCMFVPYSGASYYEMFGLGNLDNVVHFSSLHNKRGLDANLMLEIPFHRSLLRVGIGYETMKWSANDLVFKRNNLSFKIASVFDFATFAGRKKRAPSNFISPNE